MSDAPATPSPSGEAAMLDALIPESSAERRRAFAALLRAITDDRVLPLRSDDASR
jgi:hypothetical protein